MAEPKQRFIVELEVIPAPGSPPPSEWFWTDACPTPADECRAVRIEETPNA